ncbi:LLGL1 (predicted), partial [Pycnogonum litorale]
VEAIAPHPTEQDKLLIGYQRGLIVLWDNSSLQADQTFVCNQQLESICWNKNGKEFMSSHNDGSYITWDLTKVNKPEEDTKTPYGPFPCKAINKILWNTSKNGNFIIYSGGLPRASYGDRNAVTVTQGDKHQVLDFTSKVIDFFTISDADEEYEYSDPHSLVVLVEEEIVVIDLQSDDWPVFRMPYLVSLHSSAIICTHHSSNVPTELWDKLVKHGKVQSTERYSEREWPINGGKDLSPPDKTSGHELLLTGHENGVVIFWDASGTSLTPIYKLNTADYFISGEEIHDEHRDEAEEEWPPFRKVGVFDPYSDDPRLAVKKIELNADKGVLVVAGTAGQVVVFNVNNEEVEKELETVPVNIVEDRDGFHWKGHDAVAAKSGTIKMNPGFQPTVIVQISPPAAITAVTVQAEWNLLGAGTAHGLCLIDYLQKKCVLVKCTLNPNDITGAAADTSMSRRKSFKKSLRESFRRLRKGRSNRGGRKDKSSSPTRESGSEEEKGATSKSKDAPVADADETQTSSPDSAEVASKPVERQIEARAVDDVMSSIVRCLSFSQTYITNSGYTSSVMWAGTNGGTTLVFIIKLPDSDKRESDAVTCQLAKEIQLKHKAPVINVAVIGPGGIPIDSVSKSEGKGKVETQQTSGAHHHRVLICSEEQFKIFTLPQLKPYGKYKLTAHEGSIARKVGFAKFVSKSDEKYSESCVVCLNNQGQLSMFSVPDLKRQFISDCIRRENIIGILSLVFTVDGQGFYLHSPCEFQRVTISAKNIIEPVCELELPEGMRPEPEKIEDATVTVSEAECEKKNEDQKDSED